MIKEDPSDNQYDDGVIYNATATLDYSNIGTYNYSFIVNDDDGSQESDEYEGPEIFKKLSGEFYEQVGSSSYRNKFGITYTYPTQPLEAPLLNVIGGVDVSDEPMELISSESFVDGYQMKYEKEVDLTMPGEYEYSFKIKNEEELYDSTINFDGPIIHDGSIIGKGFIAGAAITSSAMIVLVLIGTGQTTTGNEAKAQTASLLIAIFGGLILIPLGFIIGQPFPEEFILGVAIAFLVSFCALLLCDHFRGATQTSAKGLVISLIVVLVGIILGWLSELIGAPLPIDWKILITWLVYGIAGGLIILTAIITIGILKGLNTGHQVTTKPEATVGVNKLNFIFLVYGLLIFFFSYVAMINTRFMEEKT
jgi:hypothetical protein